MATPVSRALGLMASRSRHLARPPVSRAICTNVRANVLAQLPLKGAPRSPMAGPAAQGNVLGKRWVQPVGAVARWFSQQPQSRHDDRDDQHQHQHQHGHSHHSAVHEKEESKKEATTTTSGKPQSFWRRMLNVRQWGLAEFGTAATILCAIDCTVFPVVLTVLPLAQLVDPSTTHHIHHITHAVALYFVLPIGSLAVGANFIQHKRWDIGGLGAAGVLTIAAAHMGMMPEWVNAYEAWVNTAGCAALLASGWWSHRVLHGAENGGAHCHGTAHCHNKANHRQEK